MIRIALCIVLLAAGTANAQWNTRAGLPWLAAEKWRGGVPKIDVPPPRVHIHSRWYAVPRPRLDPYGR